MLMKKEPKGATLFLVGVRTNITASDEMGTGCEIRGHLNS